MGEENIAQFHLPEDRIFLLQKIKKNFEIVGISNSCARGGLGFDSPEEIRAEGRKLFDHASQTESVFAVLLFIIWKIGCHCDFLLISDPGFRNPVRRILFL